MFKVLNDSRNFDKLIPQIDQELKISDFDLKTSVPELDEIINNMGKDFWQKIFSVANTNRVYRQCLLRILDAKKFNSLEDVIPYVTTVLKKGEQLELIGSDLVVSYKKHLEKFSELLNKKSNEELTKIPLSDIYTKLSSLKSQVTESKRNMKIAENKVALLMKEKKDLLNILGSYESENIHKVSLEKRLEAEQKQNEELRAMIASVFKKQMPYLQFQL